MEESNINPSSQSRFLIAAVLSMAVLFGWSYFLRRRSPLANTQRNQRSREYGDAGTPHATADARRLNPKPPAPTPDTTPARTITIKSPLYEVTLDSKGAVATSWMILKNKSPKGDFPVYADGSNAAE